MSSSSRSKNRVIAFAPSSLSTVGQHERQPLLPNDNNDKNAFSSKSYLPTVPQHHPQKKQHSSLKLSSQNDGDNLKDANPNANQRISVSAIIESLNPLLEKIKIDLSTIDIPSAIQNVNEGEFGTRGEIYVALQLGFVLAILIGNVPLVGGLVSFLFGPVLFLLGGGICLLGVGELGSLLSPWPVPTAGSSSSGLVTDGLVFKEIRHPIYAGLLCIMFGLSVWTGSAIRLVLTLGLYVLLDIKSDFEEEELCKKFGQEYVEYRADVKGKFVPERVRNFLERFKTGI